MSSHRRNQVVSRATIKRIKRESRLIRRQQSIREGLGVRIVIRVGRRLLCSCLFVKQYPMLAGVPWTLSCLMESNDLAANLIRQMSALSQ